MARTVNRNPSSVPIPSAGNLKNYTFSHRNFKGLCEDQNFQAVDQETFERAKNVYCNTQGLLRSRPSVKVSEQSILTEGGIGSIVNKWYFGPITLYLCNVTGDYYLHAVKGSLSKSLEIPSDEAVPILSEQLLFVFTPENIYYYNGVNNTWNDGTDSKIYIPTTKIFVNGVEGEVTAESPNELTTAYKIKYIYDSIAYGDTTLVGKNVTIDLGDGTSPVTITFQKNSQLTFVKKCLTLDENEFSDGKLNISVSDNGSFIIVNPNAHIFKYSVDGLTYSTAPYPIDFVILPKISRDGLYAMGANSTAVYALSLVPSSPEATFDDWEMVAPIEKPSALSSGTILRILDSDFITYNLHTLVVEYKYGIVGDSKTFLGNSVTADGFTQCHELFDTSSGSTATQYVAKTSMMYYNNESRIIVNAGENRIASSTKVAIDIDGTVNIADLINEYSGVQIKNCPVLAKESYFLLVATKNSTSFTERIIKFDDTATIEDSDYLYGVSTVSSYAAVFDRQGVLLDNTGLWFSPIAGFELELIRSLITAIPYFYSFSNDKIYVERRVNSTAENYLYRKNTDRIEFEEIVEGDTNIIVPDHYAEISSFYFANKEKLYISKYAVDETDAFQWYFPKVSTETFDYEITNLHPISTSQMAVFQEDAIYYIEENTITTSTGDTTAHFYYKSRAQVGCKQGSDVITSYDSQYVIFPCTRGVAAMTYQQLVQSTDQIMSYMTDPIFNTYIRYYDAPVKIVKCQFWTILYKVGSKDLLVFDSRNSAWWPMESPVGIEKLLIIDDKLNILSNGKTYVLSHDDSEYYDLDGTEISWYIESQKLYLSGINYVKHIQNITLVNSVDNTDNINLKLSVICYRDVMSNPQEESFRYSVDSIRTFVKHLNFFKVDEFQYRLEADINDLEDGTDVKIQVPLSLTSINVKYRVGGQVR